MITDFALETAEALAILHSEPGPVIHKIFNPCDLPGGGLYKMYQLKSAAEAASFSVEAWLLESRIIKAFYLFVPYQEQP